MAGGTNNGFPNQTLLFIGVSVAGYIMIKKVGQSLTLFKSDAEREAERKAGSTISNGIEAARKAQPTTKTDAEWASIAELISRDLRFAAPSDNKGDAIYQLCRVKNDADFWTLYNFFGKRQETWFGFISDGDPKDLLQMVRSNLSPAQINTINSNYSRKPMKVRI